MRCQDGVPGSGVPSQWRIFAGRCHAIFIDLGRREPTGSNDRREAEPRTSADQLRRLFYAVRVCPRWRGNSASRRALIYTTAIPTE
jgi:hypothetical protein